MALASPELREPKRLGCLQSRAMCRNPLHRRHRWGSLQVATRCAEERQLRHLSRRSTGMCLTTRWLASACWPSWLNRGGRWSRLLPVDDLPPPIGIGGADLSTTPEALVCWDTTLHWPTWHAVQQLWARPTVFPHLRPASWRPARRTTTAQRRALERPATPLPRWKGAAWGDRVDDGLRAGTDG